LIINPDGEIRLLNVPFLADMENVMDFPDKTKQYNYMIGQTIDNGHIYNYSYLRQSHSVKVNIPIDWITNCNYLMYRNTFYSDKWYYAWVTEMKYVNPETTELFLTTDVWNTWQFDISFKPCFIERSHVDRWNGDGTPVINRVDEGLAYGDEYDIVDITKYQPYDDLLFLVIGAKNTLETPSQVVTNQIGIVQPLSFYVQPFRISNGGTPTTTLDGSSAGLSTLDTVLNTIYSDVTAVDNIVSLCVTDYIGINVSWDGSTLGFSGADFKKVSIGNSGKNILKAYGIPTYDTKLKSFGKKYDKYKTVKESKLLMYPYTVLTMSDSKGNHVAIRNENIQSGYLDVYVRGSIGTHNKVSYSIASYNYKSGLSNTNVADLENGIINNEPNDVPIITNLLSAYLQGNKNTLAMTKAQIHFNMKMDDYKQTGNFLSHLQTNIPTFLTGGANRMLQEGLGGLQRKGNQQVELAQLMAKQNDLSNRPPSISNMGNNAYFDYGNGISGVFLIRKQIKQEYIDRLEDYFGMYGYKLQRVDVPNFTSRKYFNYIQTRGCMIQGEIPQNDLILLKGMFDKGVTVWHTADLGNYGLVNDEVTGINPLEISEVE
jgi:Caudoviral major tail protein N-terminus